nr:MAG TPA: hypothetical protein [Caudoviricetes sp.]
MSTWLTIVLKVFFTQQSPPDRTGRWCFLFPKEGIVNLVDDSS